MPTVAERAAALHGLVFWLVTVGKGQVWGPRIYRNRSISAVVVTNA